jgi:hypothetical protein
MNAHLASYYLGITIVVLSHIYMLVVDFDCDNMKIHAWVNLFAALCIAYYFMHKEQMIDF